MLGKLIKRWWPSALTVLIVLYGTLFPDPIGTEDMPVFPGYDKLIHAIMMGGIASAIMFDYRRSGRSLSTRYVLVVGVWVTVFAVADEFVQHLVAPNRTFDVLDILAGVAGVVIASVAAPPVINRIFRRK